MFTDLMFLLPDWINVVHIAGHCLNNLTFEEKKKCGKIPIIDIFLLINIIDIEHFNLSNNWKFSIKNKNIFWLVNAPKRNEKPNENVKTVIW